MAIIRSILDFALNADRNLWSSRDNLHFFFYTATVVAFYIYGEITLNENPNLIRSSIVYSLFGLFVGFFIAGYLYDPFYNNPDGLNPSRWPFTIINSRVNQTPFWEFPIDVLQIFVFCFLLVVYFKMLKFAQQRKTYISSLLMIFSIIGFLGASTVELLEHFGLEEVSAGYSMIPAFGLLAVVYIYNPKFAYASPVMLFRVIIIHENGTMIRNQVFNEKYQGENDTSPLVSGASTSINILFQEMTKTTGDLEIIKSSTSTFLMAKAPKVMVILELEKPTYMLKIALQDFTKEFARHYEKELSKLAFKSGDFDDFSIIMYRYFPFLD
ncbi:MAG: hypothetical protein INQ03_25130 [Candidatus Heimdallarchaeota archaeon]|nr:hypothetical protein [Candidatus Heimdallarchaeota archaeon]